MTRNQRASGPSGAALMSFPSGVDYRKTTGTFYVEDIYAGPGLAGVARGAIKDLRVVALLVGAGAAQRLQHLVGGDSAPSRLVRQRREPPPRSEPET